MHTVLSDKINFERAGRRSHFHENFCWRLVERRRTRSGIFYHVAATPNYLVIGPRLEAVREVVAKHSQSAGASLINGPGISIRPRAISRHINGLGYL